jgi:hypothetical protein
LTLRGKVELCASLISDQVYRPTWNSPADCEGYSSMGHAIVSADHAHADAFAEPTLLSSPQADYGAQVYWLLHALSW